MARAVLFEWRAQEQSRGPKTADWYWALGIIAVASAVGAILFANYLFAILIVVAAVTIALHSAKRPHTHRFRVTEEGLLIDEELYPFEKITSFSMLEDIEGELPPVLSLKTMFWLSPHLLIPVVDISADALYEYLLAHIDEAEHPHSLLDHAAHWLGF